MNKTTPILVVAALSLGACEEPTDDQRTEHRAKDDAQTDGDGTANGVLARIEVAPISADEAIAYYTFETAPDGLEIGTRFGDEAVLRDDGLEFDSKPGDGVYTGVVPFSAKSWNASQDAFHGRVADVESPNVMRFRGRAAVETTAFDGTPKVGKRWVPALGKSVPLFTLFPSTVGGSAATLSGLPPTANPPNSLVVTSPQVVRDPSRTGVWELQGNQCVQVGNHSGPWGIVSLLDEMGNGHVSAHDLMIGWLGELASTRTVNGQTIAPSLQGVMTLTDGDPNNTAAIPWPKFVDDQNPATLNDVFDLSQTPVQLTAIVNRTDLAASGYGGTGQDTDPPNRAELRFVFTFIDEETCRPSLGGFILEYDVPIDDCSLLEDYFADWHDLSNLQVGSPSYNAALEVITTSITAAGAAPDRPNQSNLKVLRTNEASLRFPEYPNDFPNLFQSSWDMQEFALDATTHLLINQPVAQTPAYWYELPDWNDALHPQQIDDTIAAFTGDILTGEYVVPLTDPLTNDPMLGASAMYGRFGLPSPGRAEYVGFYPPQQNDMERLMSWGSTNAVDVEARQRLSLNTCSGCHFAETFEDSDGPGSFESVHVGDSTPGGVLEEPFRHIRPDSNLANPAHLSRFMTGTNATCGPDEFVAPLGALPSCSSASCCPIGDPVFGFEAGQVHYNEFHRRGSILEDVVTHGCSVLDGHQFADVIVASTH